MSVTGYFCLHYLSCWGSLKLATAGSQYSTRPVQLSQTPCRTPHAAKLIVMRILALPSMLVSPVTYIRCDIISNCYLDFVHAPGLLKTLIRNVDYWTWTIPPGLSFSSHVCKNLFVDDGSSLVGPEKANTTRPQPFFIQEVLLSLLALFWCCCGTDMQTQIAWTWQGR